MVQPENVPSDGPELLAFIQGPPTLAQVEGQAWIIEEQDVPEGTKCFMLPFPYDPQHRVLCACGLFVGGEGRPGSANLPGDWYVDQVDGEFVVDWRGNLTPRYIATLLIPNPSSRVVCACGLFIGEPVRSASDATRTKVETETEDEPETGGDM
jgi:hypothetical protein